jgi:hypothetical protein
MFHTATFTWNFLKQLPGGEKMSTRDDEIPTSEEEEIIRLMRSKPEGFKDLLKEAIAKVSSVDNFRIWRDSRYSLLFHASMEDCLEAVEYLLERGADPSLCNDRGTCVAHLMGRKGQVEMAKKCYSKLAEGMGRKFVNGTTNVGKVLFGLYHVWYF